MKCQVYQMISGRIQFPEIVIQCITDHNKGQIMEKDAGQDTKHPMFCKEGRYIPRALDIRIPDNMVLVVIMKTILQGIEIDPYTKQYKDNENAGLFFQLRVIQHIIHK